MIAWPIVLQHGDVTLRPLKFSDRREWNEIQGRNRTWLKPWQATLPSGQKPSESFIDHLRYQNRQARSGRDFGLAIIHDGKFAGGITLGNVTWGSARNAYIGYWIDSFRAGMGITPTAVAMLADWAILVGELHRIEISIRPENVASIRVVEKLGFKQEGYRVRFLHIDNDWRDHVVYVITEEQVRQQKLTTERPLIHSRHVA